LSSKRIETVTTTMRGGEESDENEEIIEGLSDCHVHQFYS
jgi:hypothetical protein